MIIKPSIRENIALNAHPSGCHANVIEQINFIKNKPKMTNKKLNVLIIGGSSGYGLATRIALAFGADAFTYNVSFERGPKGRMTGSAGFYNNYFFNKEIANTDIEAYDLNADAFSHETRNQVIKYFKDNNKKIDIIIYSVAAGFRIDPDTSEKYVSALKPIGSSYTGTSIDVAKITLKEETVQPGTAEEINNTIKVMGGEDYLLWVEAIDKADLFNEEATAMTYTYIGSPITYPVYKDGTIGQAKRNLEEKNKECNKIMEKHNGHAYVCSSKTVVTKASTYIPSVAIYASALIKVMKEHNVHETIIEHKYRLFNDMIFNKKFLFDEDGIIRLDAYELEDSIQDEVIKLLEEVTEENIQEKVDINSFVTEFMQLNGFKFDNVDYELDIDLSEYQIQE